MTRDYRHGHIQRRSFQRRSQQNRPAKAKRSAFAVWSMAVLVSVIFVLAFFIMTHFMSSAPSVSNVAEPTFKEEALISKTADQHSTKMVSEAESVVLSSSVLEQKSVAAMAEVTAQNEEAPTPVYSFYHDLGQTEVVVEAELISVQLEQPYYIQAGSFSSKEAALKEVERLKKHGQLLELSALKSGEKVHYRLRIGPFTDRLLLNQQRNKLRKLGVDTLLVKVPQ